MSTINIGNWDDLDIEKMTNLYLYGQQTTSSNFGARLRTLSEYSDLPVVQIEMDEFMDTGPGRYARASQALVVQDFFSGTLSLSNGSYTKGDLIANHGYSEEDFRFTLTQAELDPNSGDYDLRTYVYNSGAYEVSDDVVFVVSGGTRHIEDMAIHALYDNFDFSSSNSLVSVGNLLFLEGDIDPHEIGRTVEIQIINKENVPTWEDLNSGAHYTLTDYNADVTYVSNIPSATYITDAYNAMQTVVSDLESSETIAYETVSGEIIYGTINNDSFGGTSGADVLVSGDGNDELFGGLGKDLLYGGLGSDTLWGGDGNDFLDAGGGGVDILYGGAGTDMFIWDVNYSGTMIIMDWDANDVIQLVGMDADELAGKYDGAGNGVFEFDGAGGGGGTLILQSLQIVQGSPSFAPNFSDPTPPAGPGQPSPDPAPTPGDDPEPQGPLTPTQDPIEPGDEPPPPPPVPEGPAQAPPLMGPIGDTWSPLIIDLDDDGLELTNLTTDAVYWDIDNDGYREACAWVEADDGLLVLDRNSNGRIDNHSELFGTESIDGFTILSEFDDNTDNTINSSDDVYADLKVWQDANQDGISQVSELQSLSSAGITSINLSASTMYAQIEENDVTHISSVTMADTSTRDIYDAWFQYDNQNSIYATTIAIDSRTSDLPDLRGYGEIKTLRQQMSLDETLLNQVTALKDMTLAEVLDPDMNFDEKFKEMLYQWGGQSLDRWRSDVLSQYEDARKVGFVQDIAGEEINSDASLGLYQAIYFRNEGLWETMVTHTMANFLSQTVLQTLFTGTLSYDAYTGVTTGATGLSTGGLASIQTLIDGTSDPSYGWSVVIRVVEEVIGVDNLSGSDYTDLDDAIQNSAGSWDLDGIRDLILGDPNNVSGTSSGETITGTFADDQIEALEGNDTLEGDRGDDRMLGNYGDDTYIGGSGDDFLMEASGVNSDDTYVYTSGHDVIQEANGNDRILFGPGITLSDLSIERPNILGQSSMIINVEGLGSITVLTQYNSNSYYGQKIETIEFDDTTTLDLIHLDDPVYGTSGANTMTGADRSYFLNDRLESDSGNDILNGGLGHNYLAGGWDNDTYVYGGGLDTIVESYGTDSIQFDDSYDPNLFTFEFNHFQNPYDVKTQNLNIYYDGELKVIIKQGIGFGEGNFVENLVIDGVTTISIASLDFDQHGTSGNDTLYGIESYPIDVNAIYGYAGNDYISARANNDYVDGGDGNDEIFGDDGNDILIGGNGADYIDGGWGTDTLDGGAGNDTLYGYGENDILKGGDGTDTMYGGGGSDTFVFEAASAFNNVDTIADFTNWQTDKLNIADLLTGYTSGTSDIKDFVSFSTSGGNTIVSVDRDGTASTYSSQSIASIYAVTGLDVDTLFNNGQIIAA